MTADGQEMGLLHYRGKAIRRESLKLPVQATDKREPSNLTGFEIYENSCNGLPLPYVQGVNVLLFTIHEVLPC